MTRFALFIALMFGSGMVSPAFSAKCKNGDHYRTGVRNYDNLGLGDHVAYGLKVLKKKPTKVDIYRGRTTDILFAVMKEKRVEELLATAGTDFSLIEVVDKLSLNEKQVSQTKWYLKKRIARIDTASDSNTVFLISVSVASGGTAAAAAASLLKSAGKIGAAKVLAALQVGATTTGAIGHGLDIGRYLVDNSVAIRTKAVMLEDQISKSGEIEKIYFLSRDKENNLNVHRIFTYNFKLNEEWRVFKLFENVYPLCVL